MWAILSKSKNRSWVSGIFKSKEDAWSQILELQDKPFGDSVYYQVKFFASETKLCELFGVI